MSHLRPRLGATSDERSRVSPKEGCVFYVTELAQVSRPELWTRFGYERSLEVSSLEIRLA